METFKDWNGQAPPTPKHQKGKILQVKDIIGQVIILFMYLMF